MKLILTKNLKQSLRRGHPWVYRDALQLAPNQRPSSEEKAELSPLFDRKSNLVAWGIHDPSSPIAFRVLTTNNRKPNPELFSERLGRALELRKLVWQTGVTTGLRCINGEGDGFPGLVMDLYQNFVIVQFDGPGMKAFWSPFLEQLFLKIHDQWPFIEGFYLKPRSGEKKLDAIEFFRISQGQHPSHLTEQALPEELKQVRIFENGLQYEVNCVDGQKTGFFLDQRENRQYVRQLSSQKRVLNLFCYTGGFSVAAGCGGAQSVWSVDLSEEALKTAQKNWKINELSSNQQKVVCADVFSWLARSSSSQELRWDSIIVDPPSMAKSEAQKPEAIKKYKELFSWTLKQLEPGGHAFFSSCSSHISFIDFQEVIEAALDQTRTQASIHRISGQGLDHPFPAAASELRYLKFFHLIKN